MDLTTIAQFFTANKDMLTILGALAGGGFALQRYRSDQSWRKKEHAYDYAQRVFADPKAMTALRMLDWSSGTIPEDLAREFEVDADDRHWTQAEVAKALRLHDETPDPGLGSFSAKEYAIRESFDACLAHFERLGHFMKSGVISKRDFPTTLAYYAKVVREPRLGDVQGPLRRYMLRYNFDHACYVFDKLGGEDRSQPRLLGGASGTGETMA